MSCFNKLFKLVIINNYTLKSKIHVLLIKVKLKWKKVQLLYNYQVLQMLLILYSEQERYRETNLCA